MATGERTSHTATTDHPRRQSRPSATRQLVTIGHPPHGWPRQSSGGDVAGIGSLGSQSSPAERRIEGKSGPATAAAILGFGTREGTGASHGVEASGLGGHPDGHGDSLPHPGSLPRPEASSPASGASWPAAPSWPTRAPARAGPRASARATPRPALEGHGPPLAAAAHDRPQRALCDRSAYRGSARTLGFGTWEGIAARLGITVASGVQRAVELRPGGP